MAEVTAQETGSSTFVITEPLIVFYVGRSIANGRLDVYEAVRRAWRINVTKARKYDLVLARNSDRIIGAYRPTEWFQYSDGRGRWAFVGKRAEPDVWSRYVGKRVPYEYRTQNPIRYCDVED